MGDSSTLATTRLEHSPASQPLPSTTGSSVAYVGEGMANVVFGFPDATEEVRELLLRVPKEVTGDYEPIHKHWCEHIRPLLRPRDFVPQFLVNFANDDKGIAAAITRELDRAEAAAQRKPKFNGSKIKERFRDAMLVRNMRPRHDGELLVEFKPKWLAQSPTAPAGAKRCRNCAREALRNDKTGRQDPILCPLRLLDRQDAESMRLATDNIVDPAAFPPGSIQAANLNLWLRENSLLPLLRDVQVANDRVGVLDPPDPFSLGLAMTLRDCTCYVRIPTSELVSNADEMESRLGDLDLKNQETKLDYWRDMELELIRDGFYMAEEKPLKETHCKLETV